MINTWKTFIDNEKEEPYFIKLLEKIETISLTKEVYPAKKDWFNAFNITPLNEVKVVIIGQDPYHGKNEAHGLSFSTLNNKLPKSLINIYKELNQDLGIKISTKGDLSLWAKQGVLLLNSVLTVTKDEANSHKNFGWEIFTQKAIELINLEDRPIVFLLWGKEAQKYKKLLTNQKHLILESSHPSPLGAYRGFIGSKPFSKINQYLIENNVFPINWDLN